MDQPNGLAISLEWIDLSELPDDLKVNILTRDSEHYSKLPHISKGVSNASKLQRLRNACLNPISNDELEEYKNEYEPATICQMVYGESEYGKYYIGIFMVLESKTVMSYSYEPAYEYGIMTVMPYSYAGSYLYGRYLGNDGYLEVAYQRETENTIINYAQKVDTDDDSIRIVSSTKPVGYDLITTYYIMKERESCMSINAGFAKRVVLDTLEDWKVVYDINKGEFIKNKDEDRVRDNNELNEWLYDFYAFLRCNSIIMGFSIRNSSHMSVDVDRDSAEYLIRFENTIMDLIEEYYAFIWNYLNSLDNTNFSNVDFKYILQV
jgi:hypothetical protein